MLEQGLTSSCVAACPPCQHGAFASRRNASSLAALCWNDAVNASCITLDSCGKADDPHNLEGGALAARTGHISKKRRRTLDACWDVAAREVGNSQAHPVNLG